MISWLKNQFFILTIGGLICVCVYAGYQELVILRQENQNLTLKMEAAIDSLNKISEHNQKVEAATLRLEQNDAARQQQLRGFERNLTKLAKNSGEAHRLLSTIIPDNMLEGLRSFQATTNRPGGEVEHTRELGKSP